MSTAMISAFVFLLVHPITSLALPATGDDIQVKVQVPQEVEVGSNANLICNWRVSGKNTLYSVKWYKNDHEFFRFSPGYMPSVQAFPQPGVNLDVKASTKDTIRLLNFTLESSGQYKCEVSTDAPSFATNYRTGNLTVIALPEQGPEITGLSFHYAVGENVTANCTSWPSVPKANLQWTINDKTVPRNYTIEYPPLPPMTGSKVPNILGLRLMTESRLFEGGGGIVTIRCIASVGTRRYSTNKKVEMTHVNNQRLSAGDHRSNSMHLHGEILIVFILAMIVT